MKYCAISMSVRLLARISRKPHGRISPILCMLPLTVARFYSEGVAICYVFPVLWMTSSFHVEGSTVRPVYSYKRRERNSRNYCIDSNQILLNDQQVHMAGCAPGDEVCYLRLTCFRLQQRRFVQVFMQLCLHNGIRIFT